MTKKGSHHEGKPRKPPAEASLRHSSLFGLCFDLNTRMILELQATIRSYDTSNMPLAFPTKVKSFSLYIPKTTSSPSSPLKPPHPPSLYHHHPSPFPQKKSPIRPNINLHNTKSRISNQASPKTPHLSPTTYLPLLPPQPSKSSKSSQHLSPYLPNPLPSPLSSFRQI